jgi:hypothetical protein
LELMDRLLGHASVPMEMTWPWMPMGICTAQHRLEVLTDKG